MMLSPTVVLGGGISGLSAAHYLLEHPRLGPITLLEASSRLGGWLRSRQSPTGSLFEEGPRTIRPKGLPGSNTLSLVDELELSSKIVPIKSDHPAAKNRLIYVGGKLHALPNSFIGLLRTNPPFERPLISMVMNDLRSPQIVQDDESIYSFVARRMGQDVAENLIGPMICGICAGDAKKISVNFLMRSLFEAEQKHGSVTKGLLLGMLDRTEKTEPTHVDLAEKAKKEKWAIWSLEGGVEEIPRRLAKRLENQGVDIRLEARGDEVTFKEDHVDLKINGEVKQCERIVSSLSAKVLAGIVRKQHPQLAEELQGIPMVDVAVINLEFPGHVLPEEAFGFLVPPKEKLPILGVIFDSCVFPRENSTVLTVMMGGAWFESNFGENPTEEHLLSVAIQQVKSILGIKVGPTAHNVAILNDCIPQHIVGHSQRLSRILECWFMGNLAMFLLLVYKLVIVQIQESTPRLAELRKRQKLSYKT